MYIVLHSDDAAFRLQRPRDFEIHLELLSEDKVLECLRKTTNKFTSGPDDIPSSLVRDCAAVFRTYCYM